MRNAEHFGAAIDQFAAASNVPLTPIDIPDAAATAANQPSASIDSGGRQNGDRSATRSGDRCDTGSGIDGPNKVYLPRKLHAGECVATGAFATLTKADYTPPPRPGLKFGLPGLNILPAGDRARGHLIGFSMGGSNTDTRNFVPMYQRANQTMFDHAEKVILGSITEGGNQFIQVTPVYGNRQSPIPTKVEFLSFGTKTVRCEFDNTATATYRCW